MLATVTAFLSTMGGKAFLALVASPALGMLSQTAPYKATRKWWGKACYRAGSLVSVFGNGKLGFLWQPAENLILDFLAFGVEQAAAGLRSDDVDKMADHVERLQAVGSRTRADALAEKIELLKAEPSPLRSVRDAAIAHQANQAGKESIQSKLGE